MVTTKELAFKRVNSTKSKTDDFVHQVTSYP